MPHLLIVHFDLAIVQVIILDICPGNIRLYYKFRGGITILMIIPQQFEIKTIGKNFYNAEI